LGDSRQAYMRRRVRMARAAWRTSRATGGRDSDCGAAERGHGACRPMSTMA